jgi:Uroporphyrinogen decarboxylase (URO-D)
MHTSRTRIAAAMRLQRPDRVPVMCQPSVGFVLRQLPEIDPIDFWHNHDGALAYGFCEISRRFGFDGVLMAAVGAAPLDEGAVSRIDRENAEGPVVYFRNGDSCVYCRNDLPRYTHRIPPEKDIGEVDPGTVPARLEYLPPSTHLRMGVGGNPLGRVAEITLARKYSGPDVSVHGSLYSPEDYLIDLLGADNAMVALLTEPDRCRALLERFAQAVAGHALEQIEAGVDALNVSAPWSGQTFVSPTLYRTMIAPAQAILVRACKGPGVPSYCHTCGSIGDRLEAIIDVGFDGLECLDPPPLGNVELADAVRRVGGRAFIKGNIDPVHTLLGGTLEQVRADVIRRLETGMQARGFILSTACAIAPDTPAANVMLLRELAEKYGRY